jgi:hypothetical protein
MESIPQGAMLRWQALRKGPDLALNQFAKPSHRWGLMTRRALPVAETRGVVMTCLACQGEYTLPESRVHECPWENQFRQVTERWIPADQGKDFLRERRRASLRQRYAETQKVRRRRRARQTRTGGVGLHERLQKESEPHGARAWAVNLYHHVSAIWRGRKA